MTPSDTDKTDSETVSETDGAIPENSDDRKFNGVIRYFLGNRPRRGGKSYKEMSPREDEKG